MSWRRCEGWRPVLLAMALVGVAVLGRAQEFQSWNEVDLSASWRGFDVLVPLVARTDASLGNPQLAATGVMADVALPWRMTLTFGYLPVDLPYSAGWVNVPLVAISGRVNAGRVAVTDRNRFEKLVGYGSSPVRYRNRLGGDVPVGKGGRWHFFVDDEVFFNLSAMNWNQNRLQAGGGARLGPRLYLDMYYLQKNAAGGAAPLYALGTDLRVVLWHR